MKTNWGYFNQKLFTTEEGAQASYPRGGNGTS